jgi:hypothetical protein
VYFKLRIVIQDRCVRLKIPFVILGVIYTQRYGAYTIDNWSSLRGLHLDAETCRGNLMSTIKNAYNALEHLLVILHRIMKNARHGYQDAYTIFFLMLKPRVRKM